MACRITGKMMTPCIAPLTKRSASGHLNCIMLATRIIGALPECMGWTTSEACVEYSERMEWSVFAGDASVRLHHCQQYC